MKVLFASDNKLEPMKLASIIKLFDNVQGKFQLSIVLNES